MAEVLTKEPSIEKYTHNGKPSPYDLNDTLETKSNGFVVDLTFYQGCLISIRSRFGEVSPSDATLFDRSILSQLGAPSREVYEGVENRSWVWIDGDTRIRYEDRYLSRSHQVQLEIVNTLQFFASEDSFKVDDSVLDHKWFMNLLRHQWAMSDETDHLKRMPRGDGTLTLGMAPWQVRAAIQGIQISSISDTQMQGNYIGPASAVDVQFLNQRLSHFCRESDEMSYLQFVEVQNSLMEQLGTPMGGWKSSGGERNEWEDSDVKVFYRWGPSVRKSGKTVADLCLYDKTLEEQSGSNQSPPSYKTPETHSFF